MAKGTYAAAARLARLAQRLDGPRGDLPALFAFTDPVRTPDPVALADTLPFGCGLVLRTFGRPELEDAAFALSAIARARGLVLLIAADAKLAMDCQAHGVHWPEARLADAARIRWSGLQTASAHGPSGLRRAQGLVDAAFISTAFASKSPSAKRPLGGFRIAAHARRSRIPVYALGGVTVRTVNRLRNKGISGAAAVEALSI
jgi:thiamine-phosphate pyrophosphorylase